MFPAAKVRPSSRVAPMTTGTRANSPVPTATRGSAGRNGVPRTGGTIGIGASISSPTGFPRRQATAVARSVHPTAHAMTSPSVSAASWLRLGQDPLWIMAPANRPRDPGATRCVQTDQPPADSPPIVTRAGSPPKAGMFSCTQRSAACWSISP